MRDTDIVRNLRACHRGQRGQFPARSPALIWGNIRELQTERSPYRYPCRKQSE